jgi:HEAT repeat protein
MVSAQEAERGSVQELFAAAVGPGAADRSGDSEAIAALHRLGTREVLDLARDRLLDEDAAARAGAAAILGQLGIPKRTFPDECVDALAALLEHEGDPGVLKAAILALGFLGAWNGLRRAVRFAGYADPKVRYAVAFALGGHAELEALTTLIALMEDQAAEVRSWATLGLAQGGADMPAIRDALRRRLDDDDEDTRFEALFGLARRRDPAAAAPLAEALREAPDDLALREPACQLLGIDQAGDISAEELIARIEQLRG